MTLRRLILVTGTTVYFFFGPVPARNITTFPEPPAIVRQISELMHEGKYEDACRLVIQFQESVRSASESASVSWTIPLRMETNTALAHDNDW
jgi:hypothetical protein